MSGHSNILNKFLAVSLGLSICYWLSVLHEFCSALGPSCTRGQTYFWLHLVDTPRASSKVCAQLVVPGVLCRLWAIAVQGLAQARWPVLNWKLPKLNYKCNSSHVCWSWQPLKPSIISWLFLVVVVEVAVLQERFSGLVSLDLLSEEEMPHGSPIQGKVRDPWGCCSSIL